LLLHLKKKKGNKEIEKNKQKNHRVKLNFKKEMFFKSFRKCI